MQFFKIYLKKKNSVTAHITQNYLFNYYINNVYVLHQCYQLAEDETRRRRTEPTELNLSLAVTDLQWCEMNSHETNVKKCCSCADGKIK